MRLLVFWAVSSKFERHEFDCDYDEDAFKRLWDNRKKIGARFYDLNARNYNDSMWQYGIASLSDLEDDYNDEMLDGGYWCLILELDEDFVKQIVEE